MTINNLIGQVVGIWPEGPGTEPIVIFCFYFVPGKKCSLIINDSHLNIEKKERKILGPRKIREGYKLKSNQEINRTTNKILHE